MQAKLPSKRLNSTTTPQTEIDVNSCIVIIIFCLERAVLFPCGVLQTQPTTQAAGEQNIRREVGGKNGC